MLSAWKAHILDCLDEGATLRFPFLQIKCSYRAIEVYSESLVFGMDLTVEKVALEIVTRSPKQ